MIINTNTIPVKIGIEWIINSYLFVVILFFLSIFMRLHSARIIPPNHTIIKTKKLVGGEWRLSHPII
jgi:hypothetical protein